MLRHAELVASARKDEGPISIGGATQIFMTAFCEMSYGHRLYGAPSIRHVSHSLSATCILVSAWQGEAD